MSSGLWWRSSLAWAWSANGKPSHTGNRYGIQTALLPLWPVGAFGRDSDLNTIVGHRARDGSMPLRYLSGSLACRRGASRSPPTVHIDTSVSDDSVLVGTAKYADSWRLRAGGSSGDTMPVSSRCDLRQGSIPHVPTTNQRAPFGERPRSARSRCWRCRDCLSDAA